MDNTNQKQWFIILNKSPRGPFSEKEIKELLAQGLIRHNDLALLVSEGTQSSWKFLWQHQEFDSRSNEKVPPPPEILEKRRKRTNEEIQRELENEVPIDLKSISLEDLILRSKPRAKREVDTTLSYLNEFKQDKNGFPKNTWMRLTPLFLFLAAVAGMVLTQKSAVKPKTPEKQEQSRNIASKTKQKLPQARKTVPVAPPKKNLLSAPRERDRGEVREEELLRLRQAERLKELEERARREREREFDRGNDENPEEEERGKDPDGLDERESNENNESDEDEFDEEDQPQKTKKKRNRRGRQNNSEEEQEDPSWFPED